MPPDGLAVSVIVCPLSIAGLDGVIGFASRAEFTTIVAFVELTVVGCASVTLTKYSKVPVKLLL